METIITKDQITCGSCGYSFEREKENKHCSNCFACTGCEIYYCPKCNNEIVITPVRELKRKTGGGDKTSGQ
jgi:hypothetical protein